MTVNEMDVLDDVHGATKVEQEGQTIVLYFENRTQAEVALDSINLLRTTP